MLNSTALKLLVQLKVWTFFVCVCVFFPLYCKRKIFKKYHPQAYLWGKWTCIIRTKGASAVRKKEEDNLNLLLPYTCTGNSA